MPFSRPLVWSLTRTRSSGTTATPSIVCSPESVMFAVVAARHGPLTESRWLTMKPVLSMATMSGDHHKGRGREPRRDAPQRGGKPDQRDAGAAREGDDRAGRIGGRYNSARLQIDGAGRGGVIRHADDVLGESHRRRIEA